MAFSEANICIIAEVYGNELNLPPANYNSCGKGEEPAKARNASIGKKGNKYVDKYNSVILLDCTLIRLVTYDFFFSSG